MLSKRVFDLVLAIPCTILLVPLFLVIALLIKLDSPGPVFFRQERVGRNSVLFFIYKFRTMVTNAEAKGLQITVGNDTRITKSGRLLRKYKIDELPQLINIIKGEMSLVGPRPEVPKYVAYYPSEAKLVVLSVLPGITDLASIEFKDENNILKSRSDPEKAYIEEILPVKLSYYMRYVKERRCSLDLIIILKTIKAIFM